MADEQTVMSSVRNPENHPKISVSELQTLQRCAKKHDYGYRQGLVGKDTPQYFTRGTYLHTVMELWLKHIQKGNPFDLGSLDNSIFGPALWAMRDREKGAVVESDREEINRTVESYVAALGTPTFTVVAVEVEFYADMGWWGSDNLLYEQFIKPVLLHGVIDAVVRDEDGDLWLVEHKTASRPWDQGQFNFNMQGPLYLDAWQALTGERPVGILYNFFYPKGRYETKQVVYTPDESAYVREEAENVIRLRDTEVIVRSPVWGCKDCAFKDICFAELIGQDTTLTREQRFTVDTDRKERFDAI